MVRVAEGNPSVGIVGSYGLWGNKVVSDGIPFPDECISGRQLCRLALRKQVWPWTRPTALLIRSDLIRKNGRFYNDTKLHSDHEVCYDILRNHDFGFVHQVLTYLRVHEESVTSDLLVYKKFLYSNLDLLKKYGPIFLSKDEHKKLLNMNIRRYYLFLAFSLFSNKDRSFWKYHRNSLHDLGYNLVKFRLYYMIFIEFINNPRTTLSKIKRSISASR